MNYKKKWQGVLMKKLREQGTVEVSTRNVREIRYMTELEEAGRIEVKNTASGIWTCRLKAKDKVTSP